MMLSCEIINRNKFLLNQGCHPKDSVLIVTNGSFFCEIKNKEYTVNQNEIFFFKSTDTFKRRIISPITAIYIVFDELTLASSQKLTPLHLTRFSESVGFLEKALSEDDAKMAEHFIDDILFCCIHGKKNPDRFVSDIITYLKNNLDKNISLDVLASTFNASKQWLIQRFKKEKHTTPMQYLNNLRMQKAKELIIQQEMTMGEIAFACGFETPYYFTNAFKKHFGVSPTKWRKDMVL